MRKNTEYNQ